MYIQDIELTHESTTKGKYFLITTKLDYKKASIEAKDTINYVYPNRATNNIQYTSPQYESPIIHNKFPTYTQALIHFHESNPVLETSSYKRLKSNSMTNPITPKENQSITSPDLFTIRMKQNPSHQSAAEAEVKLNALHSMMKRNQSHHSNKD